MKWSEKRAERDFSVTGVSVMFQCWPHRRGQTSAVDPQPVKKKVADTVKEDIKRQNRISEPLHRNLQITVEQPELIKANLEMDVQNNRFFLGEIKNKNNGSRCRVKDIRVETRQKLEEKEERKIFISLDHSRVYFTWNVCLCTSIC